jgi:hypothetical protein
MSALPLGLQILVWTYFLVAGVTLAGCVGLLFAGLARGRHRRQAEPMTWAPRFMAALARALGSLEPMFVEIGRGLVNGVEWLAYGGRA